ncbi:hypothetical protein T03_3125, partial [Trichinella britovi]
MESTSYAIFLCTRHNVAGNFSYNHDIVPGKSAQDNVLPLFILKVSGGCVLRPVRMVSRDVTGQWNSLGAIPCAVAKLRQHSIYKHRRYRCIRDQKSLCASFSPRQPALSVSFLSSSFSLFQLLVSFYPKVSPEDRMRQRSLSKTEIISSMTFIPKGSFFSSHLSQHKSSARMPYLIAKSYWLTTYEHFATV